MPISPFSVLLAGNDVSADIDSAITFSNVAQGGYESCSFTFPAFYPVGLGQRVSVLLGTETVFYGRVAEIGQRFGSQGTSTQVAVEGYAALLHDTPLAMIYVDRDLGQWQDPTTQRQINLATGVPRVDLEGSWSVGGQDAGNTEPGITQSFTRLATTTGTIVAAVETWWSAGDLCKVGEIRYDFANVVGMVSGDANWDTLVSLSSDDIRTVVTDGTDHNATTALNQSLASPGGRRWIRLVLRYTVTIAADGSWIGQWRNIRVFGDHQLPKRGSAPVEGFYPSDIAADAIRRTTPLLVLNTDDASGFTVLQSAYRTPTDVADIVAEMMKLAGGWHWGVWGPSGTVHDRPELVMRALPAGPTAWVSRASVDSLDLTDRLADLYDICKVQWTDTSGAAKVSTVALPESRLPDGTDRTITVDLGTSTAAGALTFGRFVLLLGQMKARRSGSATLRGDVQTENGPKAAATLRAGIDRLRISDLPNDGLMQKTIDQGLHISRVETTVDEQGPLTTVELGVGADLLDVLQSRLAVATEVALFGR